MPSRDVREEARHWVAAAAVGLLGIGGALGPDWERRQVDRYVERHGRSDSDIGP